MISRSHYHLSAWRRRQEWQAVQALMPFPHPRLIRLTIHLLFIFNYLKVIIIGRHGISPEFIGQIERGDEGDEGDEEDG
jgi:hypothetical protein